MKGTVSRQEIEGGFWGIVADDGSQYLPVNGLPETAQRDGARISFEAEPTSSGVSIMMWGKPVRVTQVRVLSGEDRINTSSETR